MSQGGKRTQNKRDGASRGRVSWRMRESSELSVSDASCLRLRSRYSECSFCVGACPVGAIRFSDDSLDVSSACLGCARCAGACPTGALKVNRFPDFAVLPRAALEADVLEVECARVPRWAAAKNALRLRCAGGIGAHDLLGLYAERECRNARVIDRGLCGDCPASDRGRHPAAAAVSAARALLEGFGAPYAEGVAFEFRRLPQGARPLPAPHAEPEPDASRRDFLRRLAGIPQGEPAADAAPARLAAKLIPIQKTRTLRALQRIAAMAGGTMPAALLPKIEIRERCANHGVCVALCPTGALRRYEADGESGMEFDASACIACGDCRNACPEQAVRLMSQAKGSVAAGATRITRWVVRECYECGREFADSGAGNLCPPCRKTRASFSQLFGAARNPHGEGMPTGTSAGTD